MGIKVYKLVTNSMTSCKDFLTCAHFFPLNLVESLPEMASLSSGNPACSPEKYLSNLKSQVTWEYK
jgi:hypothetical protein